jgi:phosphohistidine swiveling domain-containing protein
MLIPLDAITAGDRLRVGGKAYVLGRLKQAGFAVPDGFVLPADSSGTAAETAALIQAFAHLGGPVAVRSSGTAEDGASASFAGQYLTVLDVRDDAGLLDAVFRCRAAAGRAGAYAQAVGAATGSMAVLVQRFVEPRAAGVVFTRDPRDPGRLLIEAHAGRGEAVVSGTVTPARYSVDRETGAALFEGAESVIAPPEVRELVALAARVEAILGGPQDVEWAWGAAGLVLLQARPITVAVDEAPDPRVRRLTRANVGEVLPGPVTPLTWSVLVALLEEAFRRICGRLDLLPEGTPPAFLVLYRRRLYFNLDLCIDVLTRMPGVTAADAERLFLGGGATAGHTSTGVPRWGTALGGVRLGLALPRRIETAERMIDALPSAASVRSADARALVRMLDEMMERSIDVAVTHVSTSGGSAVTMALLTRLLGRDGLGDATDRTGRLLAGLDGVDSVAPALALEAIAARARADLTWRGFLSRPPAEIVRALAGEEERPPELKAELQSFFARFGHRGLSEGDLSAPSWDEDPTPVLESLQVLMKSGRSAGFGVRARREIRLADEEALLMRAGLAGRPFARWVIGTAQQWVRRREHTKSLSVAGMRHARRVTQAAATRLLARGAVPSREAVDFMSLAEIRAALLGTPVALAETQRRRRRHESESRLEAPREVDLGNAASPALAPEPATSERRGIGVSAGIAVGRARVVSTSSAALEPGEILVAPVLDAALAPLLATAAGAVAEIGGILSHGSVVAREMGVPCVVDVRGATQAIVTGDLVLVDGGTGVVRVVRDTGAASASQPGVDERPALTPVDDTAIGLHPLDDDPRARESVYLNMRDRDRGIAIVFSMAVRPGGRGEALLTLSTPDGRILFGLARGAVEIDALGFRVGGFRLDWRPLCLSIDAELSPHEAAAFPPGPLPLLLAPRTVSVRGRLTLAPTTAAVDFCEALSPELREAMRELGRHHVEQSGEWTGDLLVGDRPLRFAGRGSRDHSWGVRVWEAADYWRLFMVPVGDDLAAHALIVSARGRLVTGGFVWRNGRAELVSRVEYAAERDVQGRPRRFELELTTRSGPLRLTGAVEQTVTIPVDLERRLWRHLAGRPYRLLLHENFTRYEMDGRVGYGMAEITERPL